MKINIGLLKFIISIVVSTRHLVRVRFAPGQTFHIGSQWTEGGYWRREIGQGRYL